MKKKIFAFVSAFAMLYVSTGNPVSAAENDDGTASVYTYTSDCSSVLSLSGSTATCTSSATGYYGETTKIAVYQVLLKKTSSGAWTSVGSWQETDTGCNGYVSHTRSGLENGSYRLCTVFTVYAGSNYETILTESLFENTGSATVDFEFESVKEEIWHKMLNSIDYYNAVSGKMIYADCPGGEVYVAYQTNLDESNAYTKVREVNVSDSSAVRNGAFPSFSDANTFAVEMFTDVPSLITLDNLNKTAVKETNGVFTRENSEPLDDDERVVIEEDGTPGYYYRCDITNTFLASASLLPQEMTFGFLTDFDLWDIDQVDTYVQRECYVISGVSSNAYGKKVGVQNFRMYVDCQTGVLLKYIGYDEDENIHAYLVTEEIHFEEDNAAIYQPGTSGYTFAHT